MKQHHKQTKNNSIYAQNPPYFTSVQQNNREISSLLLTSKSGLLQTPKSKDFPSIISNKSRLENLINWQTTMTPRINEKLTNDRNNKLATLTFRQDISHLFDKNPLKPTSRDFFKDRNNSTPMEKFTGIETPRSMEREIGFKIPKAPLNKGLKFSLEFLDHKVEKTTIETPKISKQNPEKPKTDRNVLHSPDTTSLQIRLQTPNYLKTQTDLNSFLAQKVDMNLKKEFPSNQFANPSSRLEVILLLEWLEYSIKDLANKETKMASKTVNESLWQVFEVSFKELERQLIIECNERGQILRKLWDILSELIIKDRQEWECTQKKIEDAAYDEYNRLHKMYRGQLGVLSEKIEKIEKEFKELKLKNQEIIKEKVSSEQRELQFTQKLSENARILNLYKKKLKIVISENEKLVYKLENSHSPVEKIKMEFHEAANHPFDKKLKTENLDSKQEKPQGSLKNLNLFEQNQKKNDKMSDKSSEKSSHSSEKVTF